MLFQFPTDDDSGLRQSQLVHWYLDEVEGDIDSEAELLEKKAVIEKVLNRLINHVRLLIDCYFFLRVFTKV